MMLWQWMAIYLAVTLVVLFVGHRIGMRAVRNSPYYRARFPRDEGSGTN